MRFFKDIYKKLKCRCWLKFTTVCPKTLPKDCWVDRDHLMLHCMFEILTLFVEQEMSKEMIAQARDPNWSPKSNEEWFNKALIDQNKTNIEILYLYDWWHKTFPTYSIADGSYISYENEEKETEIVQNMLHRLINVRLCLWS